MGTADETAAWKHVYRDESFAARYARKRAGTATSRRRHERERRIVERALDEADLPAGGWALDIPTGQGRFIEPLRARGLRVVAADIAAEMLVFARAEAGVAEAEAAETDATGAASAAPRGPAPRFLAADVQRLPFRDGVFDVVVVIRLLHHVPDEAGRRRLLAECARVSRRFVLASFFHAVAVSELRNALVMRLRPFRRTRHAVTLRRLTSEARACGLGLRRAYPELRWLKRHWFVLFEKTG